MAGKRKADQMLAGYYFSYDKQANPYDFVTDKKTGLRKGATAKPHGHAYSDLTRGIDAVTLPPLAIWKDGEWLADMDDEFTDQDRKATYWPKPADEFDTWVVDGEGTPGNMKWRMFLLPMEMSRSNLNAGQVPRHPSLWPKNLKEKPKSGFLSPSGSFDQVDWSTYSGSGTTKTTTARAEPKMPFGTRIRCTKCGHWFEVDDLVGHAQCCPSLGFTDWAIKCDCCASMDDTVEMKPGYPREMYGVTAPAEPEATTDAMPEGVMNDGAGGETPERAHDGAADPKGSGVGV